MFVVLLQVHVCQTSGTFCLITHHQSFPLLLCVFFAVRAWIAKWYYVAKVPCSHGETLLLPMKGWGLHSYPTQLWRSVCFFESWGQPGVGISCWAGQCSCFSVGRNMTGFCKKCSEPPHCWTSVVSFALVFIKLLYVAHQTAHSFRMGAMLCYWSL